MRSAERFFIYAALAAIAVVAAGGRLLDRDAFAQADSAASKPDQSVAVCDLVSIVEKLMESDRYRPAREELQAAAEAELAPLRDAGQQIEQRARNTPQDDPSFPEIFREFQRAQQDYQQKVQEGARRIEELTVSQLKEAYEVARASAEDVAADLGYEYLIASRDATKEIEAIDVAGAVRAMLARPIILAPEDVNITPDVLADLKLD